MLYTIPDYYKEFKCTADKCEDTCCAGWQIVIDEKSLNKYAKIHDKYMWTMLRNVNWRKGVFRQDKEGRCAFLNENNLCDLYIARGEKSLCKTCRLYPRHIEEFEGLREITLSVSCPEVARILMEKEAPVKFLSYEKEMEEEEYEDFDPFLFSYLEDARKAMIEILQNREMEVDVRAMLVLGMAHDMQVKINHQELFACGEVIEKYKGEKAVTFVKEMLVSKDAEEKEAAVVEVLFDRLYELELLREEWEIVLRETEELLYGGRAERYHKVKIEFKEWQKQHPDIDVKVEQLLVYFLFTYFPGAVYDGEVFAKAQLAVYCTWMIRELWMARWLENDKSLTQEEIIELVYRFSREVEHSDENLKRVEKIMEKKWLLK